MSHLTDLVDALKVFVGTLNKGEPALLWNQLSAANGRIRISCEEAVQCDPKVDPEKDLRRCWGLMQKEAFEKNIRESERWPVDAVRLARHARAMIASAGAAAALRRDDAQAFVDWWAEAVPLLAGVVNGLPSLQWEWSKSDPNDPHALLDYAAGIFCQAKWEVAGAQDWTRHWLLRSGFPRLVIPLRTMTVPVLAHESGEGCVSQLRLELLTNGESRQYEAIQGAFYPLGGDLVSCVNEACSRVQGTVRWSLIPGKGASAAMRGKSLGAAAHVGAVLLDTNRPYDQRCVITAQMEGDRLVEVTCEREKFEEAAKQGYRRGGVAVGVKAKLDSETFEVVELATLEEVVLFASGLVTELRDYLTGLTQIGGAVAAAYQGGRSPIDLYIEPDVLKRTPRAKQSGSERREEREEEGAHKDRRERLSPEARDMGEEDIYGERVEEVEERVAWERELEGMRGGRPRCAVILGPPGQGKTELWRMTARRKAKEALEQLAKEQVSLDNVILPVKMTLRKLAESGKESGENAEQALQRMLAAQVGGEVGRYAKEHLQERRVWLFLDALDEVPAEGRGLLAEYFQVLKSWQCQVVMTSRPYAFSQWSLPFAKSDQKAYRLAPLSDDQAQSLVRAWYWDDVRGETLRNLLQRSLGVRRMGQSPYLLTLLCWIAERRKIKPGIRRTGLYEYAVTDLLGLTRQGGVEEGRGSDLLPMMREVGLSLFADGAAKKPLARDRLIERIKGCKEQPPVKGLTAQQSVGLGKREKAIYLLQELEEKRFLLLHGPDEYVAPHRSLLEYLAGAGLAEKLNESKNAKAWWRWADAKAWDPDWREVIVFAAGSLVGKWAALNALFSRLRVKNKDDYFRHRFALAAECLGEMPVENREEIDGQIDAITTEAFGHWWHRWEDNTLEAYPLKNSLGALAACNARVGSVPFLERIAVLLADPAWHVCVSAVEAVGKMGAAAATPAILERFAVLLAQSDDDLRRSAAGVVGGMGAAATAPASLERIAALLADSEWYVRSIAAELVGEMGAAAAAPVILERIAVLLADPDGDVRRSAAAAVAAVMERSAMRLFEISIGRFRWRAAPIAELAAAPLPPGLLGFKQ